jgi:hypothetical protein
MSCFGMALPFDIWTISLQDCFDHSISEKVWFLNGDLSRL